MPRKIQLIKFHTPFSRLISNSIFKKTQDTNSDGSAAQKQNFSSVQVKKNYLLLQPKQFFAVGLPPKLNLPNREQKRFFSTEIFANPTFLLSLCSLSINIIASLLLGEKMNEILKTREERLKIIEDRYNKIEEIAAQMIQLKPITHYMNLQKWHEPFIEPLGDIFYSSCIIESKIHAGISELMNNLNYESSKENSTILLLETAAIAAQMKSLIILMPDPITSLFLFAPNASACYFRGKHNNYIILQQNFISSDSRDRYFLKETLIHELTHAVDELVNLRLNQGNRKGENTLIHALNKDLQLHESTPLSFIARSLKEIKENYDESKWESEIIAYYVQHMWNVSHETMKKELPETSRCMDEMFFNRCEEFLHEHKTNLTDTCNGSRL
jgi:phage-related protein